MVIGYQFFASVRSPLDEWDVPGPFRPVINNTVSTGYLFSWCIKEVYKVRVDIYQSENKLLHVLQNQPSDYIGDQNLKI